MTWEPEIEELRKRQEWARELGGQERVEKQRSTGRLTVRERIEALIDDDCTFREIGQIAGSGEYVNGELTSFKPSAFVFGRAKIDGRPVTVSGDDFTIRGGASEGNALQKKMRQAEQMAAELRMPIVRLLDGTGGGGSIKTLLDQGYTYLPGQAAYDLIADNLGRVPVVSLAAGPVAGLGAARLVASHYSVMLREKSQVFVAGPPVAAHLGEDVTKEELGGSHIHERNGTVDDAVDTEEEAFDRIRRFLSYLPSSVESLPLPIESADDPERRDEWLLAAIPRETRSVYRVRKIITSVVDHNSFFETGRMWGRSAVTGLARIDGCSVAVIANDPYFLGGSWDRDASEKVTRLVDMAETFHLPVVHFVDNPGFPVGVAHEKNSTIRHGTRALAAIYQTSVPWCSIVIRRAYGVGGAAHQNTRRFATRMGWPSGNWGSLPLKGGIEAAFKRDIVTADDPEAALREIEQRAEAVRSPFRTAEAFEIEDVIDPRDTRPLLCEFVSAVAGVVEPGPRPKAMRP